MQHRPVICIEGNIGSGKTTVIDELRKLHPEWEYYPEPVSEWGPWLAKFYSARARWAFALQMRVLASFANIGNRIRRTREPPRDGTACLPIVVERSCQSCRFVFGQIMFNSSYMSEKEWNLFKKFYDLVCWQPDVTVHVQAPPELCLERVQQRASSDARADGDDHIDIEYLRRIGFQYHNMLNFCHGSKHVVLDGAKSAEDLALALEVVASSVSANGSQSSHA